ncbi:sugar phosphate isomerase/epimerase [Aneurinibacillus sp. Ricciae_BoGa-3]|uniref:sugar phosphate isomerase/epimerase family protein n=1 Tax=Aneurinibacillus sp. Ricciae_BoGa-3 TaxID=3022697 RepID=UPI00234177F7|nr:sugar phosphate isomerase/epimerase family protein [Aneurinibacillus sp. Ricciae_BoGa-3]WCK56300.1 sugar phosphate isomerase/epimerase [Aneurinibacillus sp. Ricciae_BoGa-3]
MKLAISSNAFKKFDIIQTIDMAADIGYQGIEILLDIPHAFPPHTTEEKVQSIKQKLIERNMVISNLNAFMLYGIQDCWHPSFIEADERERRQRINHTHDCIEIAVRLGARTLSTEPGGPLGGVDRSWANRAFISAMEELADHAEKAGVTILVEPEPDLLIETSDQFLELKKAVSSEAIGLNFDIGHFFCVGEDPVKLVDKLLPYTHHYHLEDIAEDRVHHHLIPGHGSIDIPRVLKAIQETGYDRCITIELYPYENQAFEASLEAYRYVTRVIEGLQNVRLV